MHCFFCFLLHKTVILTISIRRRTCLFWGMRIDNICSRPLPGLAHRSEEQSELSLKRDDTHRNVNGAEYFRGGIITWQQEDGWVSQKHLAVEVPLCYCILGPRDDFYATANKVQLLSGGFETAVCLYCSFIVNQELGPNVLFILLLFLILIVISFYCFFSLTSGCK